MIVCVLLDPDDLWKCQSLFTNWCSITSQKTWIVVFLLTLTLGTVPSYNHQLMCFPTMRLIWRGCRLCFSCLIILFGCVDNVVPSDRMIVSDVWEWCEYSFDLFYNNIHLEGSKEISKSIGQDRSSLWWYLNSEPPTNGRNAMHLTVTFILLLLWYADILVNTQVLFPSLTWATVLHHYWRRQCWKVLLLVDILLQTQECCFICT